MAIGLDLQDQLHKVAQLQRLPEALGRVQGDMPTIFGDASQLAGPPLSGLGRRHLIGQQGKAQDVIGQRLKDQRHPLEELFAL